MNQNNENKQPKGISLPKTFTSDLRGRQSVRATFKLSEGCIEAISIVAAHLGIKQKSLFDHLVEDARSLKSIAREIQNIRLTRQGRVQKTFVISRRSLSSLENISKNFNAPRDALVELSVQRLLPIIAKEHMICQKLESVMAVYENAYHHIASFIEKGKIIEEFQPEDLTRIVIITED